MNSTDAEIWKECKDWLEHYVIERVVAGDKVKLDDHSFIQVIGKPLLQDNAKNLIGKGKYVRGKFVGKANNINKRRGDFVYKIVYENKLAQSEIYFKPHPDFSRRVHEALINTNVYYSIRNKNKE
jgi:hypothetical protein